MARPGPIFRKWAFIAAAAIVVVLLVLPVFSTLQPGYYERYPSLQGRMANWRTSTHTKMRCADCHVDPGALGFVVFAAKSVPAFYSQLVFGPTPTNLLGVPSSAACEKCHTINRQVSPNGDLLIPHRAHIEVLGLRCAVCHKDLVHSENPQGFNKPVMATCMTCHDGKQAKNACINCHTRKEVPVTHKQRDWLDVHGTRTDTVECGTCHSYQPDYCNTTCHKQLPPSHAGSFRQTHPLRIKVRGTKGCDFCHGGETFCKECH